ncbi:MAG: alanine--tRNA ligase, partial [Nanoarchaeota archaeon]|nr:alanine--tRNA ligase [Nanoarchaeota archaeon]
TSKKWLGIDVNKLGVTCFAGDKDAPKDEEAANIWLKLGIKKERIAFLSKADNWWGPAGSTGPCGPDTEMFYWISDEEPPKFDPEDKRWVEIWNDVFMQYNKNKDGIYELSKQKNVDTGMGVERTITVLEGKKSVYETELFLPIIKEIKSLVKEKNEKYIRIIADHLKAATLIISDGVIPSNVERGYVLRRLIRRAIRLGKLMGIKNAFCSKISDIVINMYKEEYPELERNKEKINEELEKEEERFSKTLESGLKQFEKVVVNKKISGSDAFLLFQSFGFPIEMTQELAKEKGIHVDINKFNEEFKKHQELSRTSTEGQFKSGLADSSEKTTKLHTATHLLNEALRIVLKDINIHQKGSNIKPERLRFDFNFDRKLTDEELKKVEALVNEKINQRLEVKREEMSVDEAKKEGAKGVFEHKYGEKISVYSIGNFSKEICAGPHVKNIKELGKFKILKEESVSAGVRRIKAVLK